MLLHHYRFTPAPDILDDAGLEAELDALDKQTGQRVTPQHIAAFKQRISDLSETLDQRFLQGDDIRDLVCGRSWAMDKLLNIAWRRMEWPANHADIALIAVGGYGRGELHPYSDIDLLILLGSSDDSALQAPLSAFVTLLWDLGLAIGHSVRTLDECAEEARNDATIMTNLLETRTLVGSDELREALMRRVDVTQMWPIDVFFRAKFEEQQQRHLKFNNSEYGLEPNLKSSPGGLRDLHTIMWIAKRFFGTEELDDVVERDSMTDSDLRIYSHGQAFLWQLRYALHMLTHRAEDRMLFDHQRSVATLLGYRDRKGSLAVEQLMHRYYVMVGAMAELNDMLLLHFADEVLATASAAPPEVLNKRFSVQRDLIQVRSASVFKQRPSALLELFLLMAQHPSIKGVNAQTIRLIREHRHLIDDSFRRDVRNRTLFMELLRSGGNVARQLALMARYGVLGNYLPEFGNIEGLMQYDLFHIYTVDAHTMRVLSRLQSFRSADTAQDFPLPHELIRHIPKLELLWIAGLFHDLGKGRGGDHSRLGAIDVQRFCERHDLSPRDTQLVSWLVEHHLLMSWTAQKRDLAEPDVISDFALRVRSEMYLDYLYLLTVADIDATNPTLWNSWRAALLRTLHNETRRALSRGLEHPFERADWIDDTRTEARQLLAARHVEEESYRELWDSFGADYFLSYSPQEIVWQTLGILQTQQRPLVLISTPESDAADGGTKVFINTREANHLFAATAAAIDQLNASIHDARIISTEDGWTLNTFLLLDDQGQAIRAPGTLREVHEVLTEALTDPDEYPHIISRHTSRQLKHFRVPTQTHFSQDNAHQRSIVEIVAADRPGLLARVGRIFVEFDVSIVNARIATFGERVEDVFFITTRDGQPLDEANEAQALMQRLREVLDAEA
ncbi:Bifunctional uridylyltransferase/uridylyl-removing enzyme [Carnimonas sp. R-84981]|uniref:[protein-PII] uridylyltransferase n=1 Tax=Carnimonas bestiolae TaxID=3402172 RepID=UPI003EDC9127